MYPSPDPDRPTPAVNDPPRPAVVPRAAVVIGPLVVQSAATPLVGVLMLLVGITVGFLVRPLAHVPALASLASSTATVSAPAGLVLPTATTASEPSAADKKALMDAVTAQTRHFRGNPAAPVVMIEFSDYQ